MFKFTNQSDINQTCFSHHVFSDLKYKTFIVIARTYSYNIVTRMNLWRIFRGPMEILIKM